MKERAARALDGLRASFGFLSAVTMVVALVLGFGLPALDDLLEPRLPLLDFASLENARGVLSSVATATVSVAGLSFSVTLVAFTLTSQQLSPRVLRTFRTDRISQATLAGFLGTFVYVLVVLVRLGGTSEGNAPALSMTVAVVAAIASFGLFAGFISHIVGMLQPSSIIAGIAGDARTTLATRFPTRTGAAPTDPDTAWAAVRVRTASPGREVRAEEEGYVSDLHGASLVAAAAFHQGLVRQHTPLGTYVLPGDLLAELWADEPEELADAVRTAFVLGRQRSPLRDIGFPVRQLADVALKGLSPGINDPTTAINAMDALAGVLVRFAAEEPPCALRTDDDGTPRLLAIVPTLDELVHLGFEQVRGCAEGDSIVVTRLIELLEKVRAAAGRVGREHAEIERQLALLERARA